MSLRTLHLKPADYLVQRWKNGLGETREIAVDDESPFRWRVSWAKVGGSGAFSEYAGYDRSLVFLSGGVATLSHEGGKKRLLPPLVSYTFKGEAKTEATMNAPAEDFNVFALRETTKAGVYPTFADEDEDLQFPLAGQEHFLFCNTGSLELLEPNSGKEYYLSEKETLRLSRATKDEFLNVRARGRSPQTTALWVVVHVKASIS